MSLLNFTQTLELLTNGEQPRQNHYPVVQLEVFMENKRNVCYLLTELDPDDQDTAYGLCDLGYGKPFMGHISLSQMQQDAAYFDKEIIINADLDRSYRIDVYRHTAELFGFINTSPDELRKAAIRLKAGPQ